MPERLPKTSKTACTLRSTPINSSVNQVIDVNMMKISCKKKIAKKKQNEKHYYKISFHLFC